MIFTSLLLDKKYIFESKNTKTLRKKKTIFLLILFCLIIYLVLLASVINAGREENKKYINTFYDSSPDVIAVYTGAGGRIKKAISLSQHYKQPQVFISGIFSKTSIDYISKIKKIPKNINLNLIKSDRWAKNTVENVISTKQMLQKNPSFQKILIISHDYHILRIKLLVNKIIKDTQRRKHQFYFVGIKSNYFNLKNILILHKEILKLVKALFIITFWENT